MAKGKSMKASKIIAAVIAVLLIALVIGFVIRFTNCFTEDFKTFYVVYNGKSILSSGIEVEVPNDVKVRFECKYLFGKLDQNKELGYKVKILPYISDETDFDFYIGDEIYSFHSEGDFSDVFNLKKFDDYFTISARFNTVRDVLRAKYSDVQIDCPDYDLTDCYFILQVSSYDGKVVYEIPFKLIISAGAIEFDKAVIVF